jgi:plastocyanin
MKKIITLWMMCTVFMSTLMAKDIIINQKDKTFIPTKVNAKVGDNIIFKNSDGFAHNAFSDDKENEFDTGMQKPGQDISVKMKHAGVIEVECAIHPNMHLTITIKK